MEPIREREQGDDNRRSLREEVRELREELNRNSLKKDTAKKTKPWKFPFKAQRTINKSVNSDKVLVFYLTIKGSLEINLLPIYSGNIVVIKEKPYEIDPRAFYTFKLKGNKITKLLLFREIDRRPICNLDWDEVRKRGDATDSDEFLIKMALRAVQKEQMKQVGKAAMIIFFLALAGVIIYLFTR